MKKLIEFFQLIGLGRLYASIFLLIIVIFAWHHYQLGSFDVDRLSVFYNERPIWSALLFILIYALSVVAALPSLPMNLAAGFFWGGIMGGIYSTIGMTFGGWLSFQIARNIIGQPLSKKFSNRWTTLIQEEFEKNDWKFVAFARMNPVVPTGPLNYLLGLTSLSNERFICTTFFFLLPPAIAIAYIGDVLQTFSADQANVIEIMRVILVVSASVTFIVLLRFFSNLYKEK